MQDVDYAGCKIFSVLVVLEFYIESNPSPRGSGECSQCRDSLGFEGRREPRANVEALQVAVSQIPDGSCDACNPAEIRVMEQDDFAVRGLLRVDLHGIRSFHYGVLQCRERVLGRTRGSGTMGCDGDGLRGIGHMAHPGGLYKRRGENRGTE